MGLADGIAWICIGALYVGFASIQGLLARSSRLHGRARLHPAAPPAFALAVLLPATVLILSRPGLPPIPRLCILALAAGAALAAYLRPARLPDWLWSPSFGRLYLGVTMALAALWALLLTARSVPSSLIGTASVVACLFAVIPGSRQGQAPRLFEVE